MSEWIELVSYLREVGLSPAAIALIGLVSTMIYRNFRREADFQARQDALHNRIDIELIRLSKQHEECMERMASLSTANIHLDRWKAVCEDACPMAEKVHAQKLSKLNGN